MAEPSSIIGTLVTGGLGATVGGLLTAVLQVMSRRGESRATAADLVTRAAGSLVERLDRENKQLREAVLLLTDVLDEVLPLVQAPPAIMEKLRSAKRTAQRSV